jgi:anti-sigma factor RsiW
VSAYIDDAVSADESRLLERHLNICRECTLETERYFGLREKLRSLPRPLAPPDLTTRLRVVASRVRMEAAGGTSRWNRWCDRLELSLRHLMRPLALPALGGLCSAIFLFSTLAPTFESAFAMGALTGDVPTMLVTEPMLKDTAPVAFDGEAVVYVQLNDQGRITNYSIVSAPGQQNETLRRSIENSLLFTEFRPATTFGRPVAGKTRISFHNNSRIDVRG